MEAPDLVWTVGEILERLGLRYAVVGSIASTFYGEPRTTNDVDIVVDLKPADVGKFCASFPEPQYYCPQHSAMDSARRKFPFNILLPEDGLKIDVMPMTDSEFDRLRLARAQRIEFEPGRAAWFASPEDVIVKKLYYFREGGSDKHVRDILGMLKISGELIDRDYIAKWAAHFGCAGEWEMVLRQSPPADQ